jgi:quercetin dioxygenase-like cupin family protein
LRATTKATIAVLFLAGVAPYVNAQTADHRIVTPQDMKWSAAPAVLPKGAEMVLLYGDPSKEGPFSLRLRFPANYHVPPHTHPVDEIVTVLSGTFKLGMGETADESKAKALPAGSFFGFPPGMAHFVYTDEPTVFQINSVGPWALNYVNPADDPRKAK